jgi:hypothetical protein
MNFPLENPIVAFLYWLANTPGLGGIALVAIAGGCAVVFAGALRWITRGGHGGQEPEYPYPTSALHKHR